MFFSVSHLVTVMIEYPDRWWFGSELVEACGFSTFYQSLIYPALARLERSGRVEGRWVAPFSGKRHRRQYRIIPD